jgi:outer membrane protein OmpA-like peptidoglycan-associated protein
MRKTKFLSVLFATALLLAGCGFGKMIPRYPEVIVKLENPDLENKGGKVDYKVTGSIPAKYMKKKATMTIIPTLIYEGGNYELTPIQLQGEKAKSVGTVIPYKAGGTFSSSGSFDYKDQYEEALIVAKAEAKLKKKSHTFDDVKLGEGISNTASRTGLMPTLKEKSDIGNGTNIILGSHQYKPEFATKTGVIYFEVNRYNLNMNLKLNKEQAAKDVVQQFIDFIAEGHVIDKIVVTGWASPEGEESRNQDLSKNRTAEGEKWFNKQFENYLKDYAKQNNLKYKDMPKPELVIQTKAAGEDWSGFEKAVEKSSIAEKNQILNVVRSQNSSEMKEQKIREMTDIYNEIKEMILPPLRRVEVAMTCNMNNFNDKEIAELVKTNPDTLKLEERLYGAFMTQKLNEKAIIYQAITETEEYQTDWRAYNNLGALQLNSYLENGNIDDLEKAKTNLNKANAVSPSNGIVLNNLAITEFLMGNRDIAITHFQESKNATIEPINQNYNLALLNIASGDYAGAKQMMNNKNCDYNMALVQLLEKNYTAAKTSLDCIQNKDAKVYYLQAVLAARTNNANDVIANLKEAIARDASYKATAKKDAEFKKFRKSSEFQALIK